MPKKAKHEAASNKPTPMPSAPQPTSTDLLFHFSGGRSVSVTEAIELARQGAFRDGSFNPTQHPSGHSKLT